MTFEPEIDVLNEHEYPIEPAWLMQAAAVVIAQHLPDYESGMTIVIETDEAVAALNQQFRGIDAPTDVLSFPADDLPEELDALMQGDEDDEFDDDEPDDDSDDASDEEADDYPPVYLGDLVIAYPYALSQAEREGHDPGDSFALLVVHGTLHLLGYDHDTPENRAAMWAAQEAALLTLGISPALVPPLEAADHDETP